ncbi:hypothetical protein BaRGS_00012989 [Batillaria attramentaria]|uniref:Uncharacterized protein n=1 Tax=Batillaria attramentaria TaxID=370345 RepID=A0ABD0L8N1_9CAEN
MREIHELFIRPTVICNSDRGKSLETEEQKKAAVCHRLTLHFDETDDGDETAAAAAFDDIDECEVALTKSDVDCTNWAFGYPDTYLCKDVTGQRLLRVTFEERADAETCTHSKPRPHPKPSSFFRFSPFFSTPNDSVKADRFADDSLTCSEHHVTVNSCQLPARF